MAEETPQQRIRRLQREIFEENATRGDERLPLQIPQSRRGAQMSAPPSGPELLTDRERRVRDLSGMQDPGMRGAADTFATSALNSALFGNLPRLEGAIRGPGFEEEARAQMEAQGRVHPMAQGAGDITGAFLPPGGTVSTLSARGAARAIGPLARAVEGSGTVEYALARRAGARMMENLAGGASALTAYNMLRDREDRAGIVDRLEATREQLASPIHLGLTATATALQAKLGREIDREMKVAQLRFERETGTKLPVEAMFASSASAATYRALAQLPGRVRHRVSRMENDVVAGIERELDGIAKRVSGRGFRRDMIDRPSSAPAGAAIRRIGGVAETREPGALQRASSDAFEAGVTATQSGLDAMVPMAEMRTLRAAIATMRSERPQTEASRIEPILRKLEQISTVKVPGGPTMRTPITLRDLEGLKKNLGFYRKFKDLIGTKPSDRTRYEAGQLYDVVSGIERRAFPEFANALDDVAKLKQYQASLPQRATIDVDDYVVDQFFKPGKGMLKRWEAAEVQGMPGDLDVLRGWYISDLFMHATDGKGALSPEKLIHAFNDPRGRFNRQAFDRIIPGGNDLRRELVSRAKLHERLFTQTRLATAGKSAPVGFVGASAAGLGATAGAVAWMLDNPWTVIPAIIGPIGLQVIVTRALVGGRGENLIRRASVGGAPIARTAVAGQRAMDVFSRVPSAEAPSLPISVPQTLEPAGP